MATLSPVLTSLFAALFTGCIVPPAILPGGDGTISLHLYPPGTELVELPIGEEGSEGDADFLRGVWVPSDPGAPVVLHLLESKGSVTDEAYGWATGPTSWSMVAPHAREIFGELAHAGFASLAVDYRGVGASDGERSPRNLARDAQVAWDEALRRAGGRPERVIVRATSIGTLATAHLLEAGARPAAVLLASPVLAETVVDRFGRAVHGAFLYGLAAPFLQDVTDADLVAAVRACQAEVSVWALAGDELFPIEDQALLRAATEDAGGRWQLMLEFQPHRELPPGIQLPRHVRGALAARGPLPGELETLDELFPGTPPKATRLQTALAALPPTFQGRFDDDGGPAAERLARLTASRVGDDPVFLASVALRVGDPDDAQRILDWSRPEFERLAATRSPEQLAQLLSPDDPAGTLPLSPQLTLGRSLATVASLDAMPDVDRLLELATGMDTPRAPWEPDLRTADGGRYMLKIDLHRHLWEVVRREGSLPPEDVARQALRILFRASGREERVTTRPDGGHQLEVLDDDGWRVIDPRSVLSP